VIGSSVGDTVEGIDWLACNRVQFLIRRRIGCLGFLAAHVLGCRSNDSLNVILHSSQNLARKCDIIRSAIIVGAGLLVEGVRVLVGSRRCFSCSRYIFCGNRLDAILRLGVRRFGGGARSCVRLLDWRGRLLAKESRLG
jgi:hypothetical protein